MSNFQKIILLDLSLWLLIALATKLVVGAL